MVPVPARTLEQRRAALDQANRVRVARAVLKNTIRAAGREGSIALVLDVLEDHDAIAAELGHPAGVFSTLTLSEVLLALPHFGDHKVGRIFRVAHVARSKTLAGLTDRQRDDVAAELIAAARQRGVPIHRQLTERTAA